MMGKFVAPLLGIMVCDCRLQYQLVGRDAVDDGFGDRLQACT